MQLIRRITGIAAAAALALNVAAVSYAENGGSDAYNAFEQLAGYASELYIDSTVTKDDIIVGAAKKFVEDREDYKDQFPELDNVDANGLEKIKTAISRIIGDDEDMLITFFKCAMQGLDKYSDFMTPEEYTGFTSDLNQQFFGIGVVIKQEDDRVEVQGFTDNSAAEAAGVQEGDYFKRVEDEDVTGLSLQEVRTRILGELGAPVKITFGRGDDEYTVTIERCEVRGDTVSYDIIDDSVGYIRITDMGDETDNEFWVALGEMDIAGIKDIIIDLRYNGGGFLQTAVDLAREIVPYGLVCSTVYRTNPGRVTNYLSYVEDSKYRIKVLVNEGTASAAEIFASAIQDSGCGMIYGEQTYGKGVIQTTYTLANGSVMKITTGKYLTRNGNEINKIGITPDVGISNKLVNVDMSQYTPFDFETEWKPGSSGDGVRAAKEKLCLLGYYDGIINNDYSEDFCDAVEEFRTDNDAGEGDVIDSGLQKLIDEEFSKLQGYDDTQLESVIELFRYNDIDSYPWAQAAIAQMSMGGVVQGTGNGEFSPEQTVTRAEFAAMLVRAFDIDEVYEGEFADTSTEDWFYEPVSAAAGAGIVLGDENGYFDPYGEISRQDMALMLRRTADYAGIHPDSTVTAAFSDWDMIDDYAKTAVTYIASAGIMTGMGDGVFSPTESATRAQAVVVMDRLLTDDGEMTD